MNRLLHYGLYLGLVIMSVFLSSCSNNDNALCSPQELTVGEGFTNPLGFHDPDPVFSWKLPVVAGLHSQNAYRIVAASRADLLPEKADLWDSGKVLSDQSIWIQYEGKPLLSRQKVYWQVRFQAQDISSDWSSVASFELGLLDNADWNADWMRLPDTDDIVEEIVIEKAIYGDLDDPTRQVDLTAVYQKQIDDGKFHIRANNRVSGNDPAPGIFNSLHIEYTVDGKDKTAIVREGRGLDIVPAKKFVPEYLRKEFLVGSSVEKARLYVTAKGLYEVWLNGSKVGNDFMAPGFTPYQKRIETMAYDVTEQIQSGRNSVGVVLGEGWFAGRLMAQGKKIYPQVRPSLLLQLEVVYEDGRMERVVSDQSWRGSRLGPIRFSGIYDGEIYDARLEMDGWSEAGFDDQTWQSAQVQPIESEPVLMPKRHHPVRATKELQPLSVTEPAKGKFVFDLGQNMVGWARINIPVKKDQTITVHFAEMLKKDGTLYTENYRDAKSTDTYISARDGVITWNPVFTFHGFRYVELSGFSGGVEPEKNWVTGVVLHSDFKPSGTFMSSHAKLNRLQQNIRWSQRGNFLDIPTDCPQRNERLGWTGDAQVFCPTSMFNYNVHSFWMSWLQSVREDQKPDGLIPHVVPEVLNDALDVGSPGWGDVGVTAPWDVYVRTGELAVLKENYDMMKKWTAAYQHQAHNFIVDRWGFGDWLQPYPESGDNFSDTPKNLIATAYFGRCVSIMNLASEALGQNGDAKNYEKLFSDIRKAFSETFFDETGKLTVEIETQTGYLMAIGYDLLLPDLKEGAVHNLVRLVDDAGGHLRTGFLGTPLLTSVLDRVGRLDLAYTVLFKETYPSWFFSINQGATTMWERWNSYSHADGFGDAGMNSFNHYAYGAIGQWMYERMAGLAPDPEHPGYKHFFIQPAPGGPLESAHAELNTPYGLAESGWEKLENGLLITATVPPNSTATVIVPNGGVTEPVVTESGRKVSLQKKDSHWMFEVKPGTYQFKVEQ